MNIPYHELSAFLIHHWQLSLAFIVILGIWIGLELRYTFNGVPQLTPPEATLLINREDPVILDVRDISHFTKNHIQGAINIPIVDLPQGHGKLEQHKEKKFLLVCQQGMQSGQAAQILHKQGFQHLVILKGGMQSWLADSMPVVKGNK
jgi:rhodanese-related sulfurtransferase